MVVGWLRRFHVFGIALVLCLIGLTFILFYYTYGAAPVQVAYVTANSTSLSYGVGAPNIQSTGNAENGLVPLAVSGSITVSSVSRMTLIIGPSGSTPPRKQTNCCEVSNGTYGGTAQLGTAESSVPFRLIDSDSSALLAAGNIASNVESFPGGSRLAQKIIAYLGLLVTIIALAQGALNFMARRERQQHETVAGSQERTSHAEKT